MASGHVNRINRPNTWLLRLDVRSAESPCQRGAVHTWHPSTVRCSATIFPLSGGKPTVAARTVGDPNPPFVPHELLTDDGNVLRGAQDGL